MNYAFINPAVLAMKRALRERFLGAKPFRHVVIDDFFDESLARALLREFPQSLDGGVENLYGDPGKKASHPNLAALGPAYRFVNDQFREGRLLEWMAEISDTAGLTYDESNFGGGTHENFEGRDLRPHVDFNYHPSSGLHRRLNLIVYLNENWRPEWGGSIRLHSDPRDPRDEPIEYLPTFNRAIVFETTERSWHGFERITLPPEERGRTRKSLSIYLYSNDRPAQEVRRKHTTFYVPRPLPARFIEGHVLTAEDAAELDSLIGQRDRLIELYQRQMGAQEPDSQLAARLRIALNNLKRKQHLPILGYVRTVAPAEGLTYEGFVQGQLELKLLAELAVTSLAARVVLAPHSTEDVAKVELTVNGQKAAAVMKKREAVTVSLPARESSGAVFAVSLAAHALGSAAESADIAFHLESLTFEHGSAAPTPAER